MFNIANYPEQSNTQLGPIVILAAVSLLGMEGRLAKSVSANGVMKAALPTNVADEADLLILEGAAAGENVTVLPIPRDRNIRVRLKGACNPTDKLCLAAIAGNDAGKVRVVPEAAGTYWTALRAEEAGVDGQLVLCRLLPNPGPVTVSA